MIVSTSLSSEVIRSSDSGFLLSITRTVSATPETAYMKFLQVDQWWVESHTWFGNRSNLSIDPVAGGCFCEIEGDKQVQHLTVTHVRPGVEFRMTGGLGPLQDMAISGAATWKFKALESGTEITHTYTVTGPSFSKLKELAPVVDTVHVEQTASLVEFIEESL